MSTAHQHGVRDAQRSALTLALVANGAFLGVEVVGGLMLGSLSLLADAAHMASDVAALTVALVAQVLVGRPATTRHSYGLQRAEVLGAQANGLLLVAAAGWIVYAAIGRIGDPPDIPGGGLLAIALVGLAVNVVSALWLARARGGSLNMHGAFLHMALDAVGSVAVVVTAVAIIVWDATWMDPVASLAIAALILWSAFGLLRDAAHVLLEGTPRGMWPAEVEASLLDDPEVEAVHHLHLWNLASDVPALSAHVVLRGEVSLHEAQASSDRLKTLLEVRHGITHATLELECHPCDPEDAGHR